MEVIYLFVSKKLSKAISCLMLLFIFAVMSVQAQAPTTATWTGSVSTKWEIADNWDPKKVPDANTHVVIGPGPFTNQPESIQNNQNEKNKAECLSLTIGGGASEVTLTIENLNGLHIGSDLNILSNGRLHNRKSVIYIKGNWDNDGRFTEEVYFQNNNWVYLSAVAFNGTNQTIGGTSENRFGVLYVYSYVTLLNNIRIQAQDFNYGSLDIQRGGVLDPGSNKVNWGGATGITNGYFSLRAGATAKVKATNFIDNYSIYPTPPSGGTTIEHTSTIDYAGTIDQNIDNQILYQKLVISGSGVKSLIGPTNVSGGAADTEVNVKEATLDLGTHTLTRATAGGNFIVANGATVKIGGPTNTPVNFTTRTFYPASTTEYYGGNQAVQHNTYGHLTFSNTGVKTIPTQDMTVQGNLTSIGTTSYTGAAPLTVGGNLTIGTGSAFTAGNFIHTIAGNWLNNGTFTPGTGTITFNGNTNTTITGGAVFYGLTINKGTANKVILNNNATATNLTMTSGDLHTEINSVFVLGTRTGNGWIVGTITRQHSFLSGSSYAFNGPYAALTFTGASGINEVTMRSGMANFEPTGFVSGKAMKRLYEIIIPTGTYTNANLQLQYLDSELNGCEEDGLKLYFAPTAAGVWRTASRHAYNATQNWVQRNTLTNVTGFWTLTDNPSTYNWDGTQSIAWEDGRNWEVVTDGESTRGITGPISSDFVVLGENVPQRQPTITFDEWVKDVSFKGSHQITLTMGNGSLRTNGDLGTVGSGTSIQHILSAGSRTINVGGNLNFNDGNAGNSITLNNTSGTINVTGNVAHHNTGSIVLGSGNLNIGGNYNYTAGSFTGGTGTVTYNGTATQVVAGVPYHHLTINKASGTANFTSATTQNISGNLTMNAGTMALNVPTINVPGNVVFNAGNLLANASTIDLKGSWLRAGGTFTPGTSTVIFSGTANQTVPATSFHNLSKTTTNTLTTTGSSTLSGNLNVQSGRLVLNGFTLNNTSGGSLTVADNAILDVRNAATYPANYSASNLAFNSEVIYTGGNTPIENVTYGKLTINSTIRTLKGNTRVANLMLVNTGGTLPDPGTAYTLTLDNNLTNNGNINAPNLSMVFTNAAANLNGTGTGNTTLQHLTVNASAALTVSKNLTVHGNLTNNGNSLSASGNWVNMTGTNPASITSAVPITINELRVTKTAAATTVALYGDVNGLQTINVNTGTLDARNHILTKKAAPGTSLTILNGATMKIGHINSLPLFDSYTLNPTSTVVYNGSNQTIKSVQYGHLDLQNTATATFEAGIAKVAGNMTKNAEAVVITPQTIEFNGIGAQLMPGINYKNLLISGDGVKTLSGNAVIDETLTFAANLTATTLNTGANEIALAANASLVNETNLRRIVGTIKTTRTVDANAPSAFGGIGITITPKVSAGLATMVRITGPDAVVDGKSIGRQFQFIPAEGRGKFDADITATYFASELDTHDESILELVGSVGPGFGWYTLSAPEGLSTTTKTITASGVNSINYMTIQSRNTPLPVELVYFEAKKEGINAELSWQTASEENNVGFEVEVSADGKNYYKIGFVESKAGNSSVTQNYTFVDNRNGKNGTLYYRLKQLDADGTYKFYGPRTVSFETIAQTQSKAYPNPFVSEVNVDVSAAKAGKATFILYTLAGKQILNRQEELPAGASVINLGVGNTMPPGLYLLTIELAGKTQTIKLVKK